jgi:hypothetical protein
MNGEVHLLPLAVLLAAALPVLYLFVRGLHEERKYKVEQKHVRCRTRGNQLVECTLVRDAKTGVPIGIRECSAHAGAEGSHCEMTCLPLFAHPA